MFSLIKTMVFQLKPLKFLRNLLNSASSRWEIDVLLEQNNDFQRQSMESLRNAMNSWGSRREIDVVVKQNNDFR